LLLASPTYKGISNNEVIVEDQTIKPIETSFNLDALPFPNSRIIRVAIYDEPNNTETSYTGGHSGVETNNVSKVVELLSVKPNIHISILTNADISLHVLTTASFDVLILPDNHPREWILDMIHDFWLGGGGILALDGSALFFNHLGILPPEAIGTDGYGVYWDYTADGFNFTTRHPVSKAFSVDAYVEPPGFYGHFGWDWSALSGSAVAADITPLAHDFSDANVITALAFDPTDRGGKIVTIGHDLTYNYNPEIDPLIVDSIDWLAPRPKGRILFDYTHHPYYSIDVWDDLAHWTGEYETYRDNLVSREYTFDKLYPVTSGQNISYPKLEPYDMFIVVAPDVGYNYTVDEIAAIEAWVIDGGSLFVVGENPNSMPDEVFIINQLLTPYDLRINDGNVVQTSYEGEIPHPITEDATQLLMTSNGYINITGDAFHPEWNYTIRPRRRADT